MNPRVTPWPELLRQESWFPTEMVSTFKWWHVKYMQCVSGIRNSFMYGSTPHLLKHFWIRISGGKNITPALGENLSLRTDLRLPT